MSDEQRFPSGMYAKNPHSNAPDFVKAKLSIKREEVIAWLQGEPGEWVNLDLKESREGKLYISVDDWKPPKSDEERAGGNDLNSVPF